MCLIQSRIYEFPGGLQALHSASEDSITWFRKLIRWKKKYTPYTTCKVATVFCAISVTRCLD